jgi:hypothetical protein
LLQRGDLCSAWLPLSVRSTNWVYRSNWTLCQYVLGSILFPCLVPTTTLSVLLCMPNETKSWTWQHLHPEFGASIRRFPTKWC